MKFIRPLLILLALFTTLTSIAQQGDPFSELFAEEPEFLPVDEAFQFDFKQHNNELVLSWTVAEGYYLYKKQWQIPIFFQDYKGFSLLT